MESEAIPEIMRSASLLLNCLMFFITMGRKAYRTGLRFAVTERPNELMTIATPKMSISRILSI